MKTSKVRPTPLGREQEQERRKTGGRQPSRAQRFTIPARPRNNSITPGGCRSIRKRSNFTHTIEIAAIIAHLRSRVRPGDAISWLRRVSRRRFTGTMSFSSRFVWSTRMPPVDLARSRCSSLGDGAALSHGILPPSSRHRSQTSSDRPLKQLRGGAGPGHGNGPYADFDLKSVSKPPNYPSYLQI